MNIVFNVNNRWLKIKSIVTYVCVLYAGVCIKFLFDFHKIRYVKNPIKIKRVIEQMKRIRWIEIEWYSSGMWTGK